MSSKGYQAVSDQDYDHVGEPGEVFEDKRITIGKIWDNVNIQRIG